MWDHQTRRTRPRRRRRTAQGEGGWASRCPVLSLCFWTTVLLWCAGFSRSFLVPLSSTTGGWNDYRRSEVIRRAIGSSSEVPGASSLRYTSPSSPSLEGLSKFHLSILSRTADRQRFVTGRYPVTVSVTENPTRKWLNLGRSSSSQQHTIAETELLVNGTSPARSLGFLGSLSLARRPGATRAAGRMRHGLARTAGRNPLGTTGVPADFGRGRCGITGAAGRQRTATTTTIRPEALECGTGLESPSESEKGYCWRSSSNKGYRGRERGGCILGRRRRQERSTLGDGLFLGRTTGTGDRH